MGIYTRGKHRSTHEPTVDPTPSPRLDADDDVTALARTHLLKAVDQRLSELAVRHTLATDTTTYEHILLKLDDILHAINGLHTPLTQNKELEREVLEQLKQELNR